MNQTVPYGTALLGCAVPGTSCQATIAPSLRDISERALARCCCECLPAGPVGTTPIVARHEVPGKASPQKEPSRRVPHDRAQSGDRLAFRPTNHRSGIESF